MPYVVALKPSHAWWAPAAVIGAVWEVATAGGWGSAEQPGAWVPVQRPFRDGHTTPWWVLEAHAGPYGPKRGRRLVVATTDPATLPEATIWYLTTTLPLPEADPAEVVHLYGRRNWIEQQLKQIKHNLGWSQYQVRSDRAMRRHWALVQCAFAFCWWADTHPSPPAAPTPAPPDRADDPSGEGEGKGAGARSGLAPPVPLLARGAAAGAGLAGAGVAPVALLDRLTDQPPQPPLQTLLDWLHQGRPLMLYDTS